MKAKIIIDYDDEKKDGSSPIKLIIEPENLSSLDIITTLELVQNMVLKFSKISIEKYKSIMEAFIKQYEELPENFTFSVRQIVLEEEVKPIDIEFPLDKSKLN